MTNRHDTKLMSYAELAQSFSMTVASARNLARRRHWKKVPSNSGDRKSVLVVVPIDALTSRESASDVGSMQHPDTALAILARHIESLQADVASLRGVEAQVAGLQAALDASREEASTLRAERDDYLSRLLARRRWWEFRKAV